MWIGASLFRTTIHTGDKAACGKEEAILEKMYAMK